jgi:hypothetical protein
MTQAERRCVHCGEVVAPERTWICNHCGKLFAGEEAEQAVREQSEAARAAEAERAEEVRAAALEPTTPTEAEESDVRERVTLLAGVEQADESRAHAGTVEGELDPRMETSGSGSEIRAYTERVPYRGHGAEEIRYAWTLRPDPEGRFHSVTLHLQTDGRWHATADLTCASEAEAEAWARRQFSGGEPAAVSEPEAASEPVEDGSGVRGG